MTTPSPSPSWPPTSEAVLQAAAANGLLSETHTLDIKRELPPGQSGNRDIAKDIAAFSLDGGTIVIGVDETASGPVLKAMPLDGLAERIEQIAATAVDEAALITTTVVESADDPTLGYLLVHIPIHPRAPLMAGGKYYGRGDKANRVLPHAEVLRLHERQLAGRKNVIAEAHAELAAIREDCPDAPPEMMLLLAEPLGGPDGLLVSLSEANDWHATVLEMVRAAGHNQPHLFEPSLVTAATFDRRAEGVALTTGMYMGRFTDPSSAAELVFTEAGRLYLASNRTILRDRQGRPNVFEVMIVGHTKLLTRLCLQVANRYGYTGSWQFALVVTGIRGANSEARSQQLMAEYGTPYTSDVYEASTTASLAQLTQSPHETVRALVGKLLRSLGSQQWVQIE